MEKIQRENKNEVVNYISPYFGLQHKPSTMKIFFLSTGFQWPTPKLFDKIGAAHPWSGTEKTSDPPPNQNQ